MKPIFNIWLVKLSLELRKCLTRRWDISKKALQNLLWLFPAHLKWGDYFWAVHAKFESLKTHYLTGYSGMWASKAEVRNTSVLVRKLHLTRFCHIRELYITHSTPSSVSHGIKQLNAPESKCMPTSPCCSGGYSRVMGWTSTGESVRETRLPQGFGLAFVGPDCEGEYGFLPPRRGLESLDCKVRGMVSLHFLKCGFHPYSSSKRRLGVCWSCSSNTGQHHKWAKTTFFRSLY